MRFSTFLIILLLVANENLAQKRKTTPLNRHFYQVDSKDQDQHVYTQISFETDSGQQVFWILDGQNRMVMQKKISQNQEGNFLQEISETFDSLNNLISQTIKNLDNSKYISFYYQEGKKIAEVTFEGIGQYTVWRENPEQIKTSERDDFKPGLEVNELNEIFSQNLRYPISARQKREEGTVMVALHISENGELLETEIANPEEVSKILKEEALRVFKLYKGPFYPALDIKGNPIQKWMYVPVRFRLG